MATMETVQLYSGSVTQKWAHTCTNVHTHGQTCPSLNFTFYPKRNSGPVIGLCFFTWTTEWLRDAQGHRAVLILQRSLSSSIIQQLYCIIIPAFWDLGTTSSRVYLNCLKLLRRTERQGHSSSLVSSSGCLWWAVEPCPLIVIRSGILAVIAHFTFTHDSLYHRRGQG